MIRDHTKITLDVDIDDSAVDAEISVSLGLIVTELVINALKHAFPDGRDGKIVVRYALEGPVWTLSVTDDGAGMSPNKQDAKAGLGTSIVGALSAQLGGDLKIASSPKRHQGDDLQEPRRRRRRSPTARCVTPRS